MSLKEPVIAALVIASLAFTAPRRAEADDLHNALTGYTLTLWGQKDGLPPGTVSSTAQDHDGYLWVGTESGLVRFDGLRFSPWASLSSTPLPKTLVRALFVSREDDIWIGFGEEGGVSRIRRGQLRNYDVPSGSVTAIVQDSAGAIWAGGSRGLFKLTGDTWAAVSVGALPASVSSLYADGARFLVGTSVGVFRRVDDERFERIVSLEAGPRAIAVGENGATYLTDPMRGFGTIGRDRRVAFDQTTHARGSRLLYDREGDLWVGTVGQGLWRVRRDKQSGTSQIESASVLTGLLSNGVFSLTEDRDGNIWAGTPEGLARFTPQRVSQVTGLGLVMAVVAMPNADVWVATTDELIRFPKAATHPSPKRISLEGSQFQALHADREGALWVATDRFLARVDDGHLKVLPGAELLHNIDWLASDGTGGLWINDVRKGLAHWVDGRLSLNAWRRELGASHAVSCYADSRGRLWIALDDGRVALFEGSALTRTFGPANGLDDGVHRAIYEDSEQKIWLGGVSGVSRFDGDRFVTVAIHGGFTGTVGSLLDDGRGSLWLGTSSGIVRFKKDEFEKARVDSAYQLRYTRYERSDGLAGVAAPSYGSSERRAIRASDGRLWFVTARGLTVIDPLDMNTTRARRPVRVEGIVSDAGTTLVTGQNIVLPHSTRKLEIEYTTLNLTSALRTRFRYRLDGFDNDWVNGGVFPNALYTNLPAGRYRFHVMATDEENAWSDPETVLGFSIEPMFYQTAWFLALSISSLVLLLWGAWALRVRRIERNFSLVIAERARLGREIHDTLLQGLVGVALQCDMMANDPEIASRSTKERFLRLRKGIEEYIREARQAIWSVRSAAAGFQGNLAEALRSDAAQAAAISGVTFDFRTVGTPVQCTRRVEEELIRIAREAVVNVVRHAHATTLWMELQYEPALLTLRVSDDGCGFEPAMTTPGQAHYGLIGIQERAIFIAGTLTVVSHPGTGTSVEIQVPIASTRTRWSWLAAYVRKHSRAHRGRDTAPSRVTN